jgi:hypothetical protein
MKKKKELSYRMYLTCDILLGLLGTGNDSTGTKSFPEIGSLYSGGEAADTVPKIGSPGILFTLCNNKSSSVLWLTHKHSHVVRLSLHLSVKMPVNQLPSPTLVNNVTCAALFHAIRLTKFHY